MADTELNAIITRRIDLAPGLWIVYVAPDGWELADFEPGQYTTLALPGAAPRCEGAKPEPELKNPGRLIRRAYSIASSPRTKTHLEFYLVLVEEGVLTPRLFNLKAGDRVWMGKKITGTFVLNEVPDDANLVLVATGTGIAPYVSMLRTIMSPQMKRHVAVFHGARQSWDLGYDEELYSMARTCERFAYVPTISRPQNEFVPWKGRVGYVQDIWKERVLDDLWGVRPTPDDTHIFLCGSPGMIDQNIEAMGADGFVEHTRKAPGQIHVERYW